MNYLKGYHSFIIEKDKCSAIWQSTPIHFPTTKKILMRQTHFHKEMAAAARDTEVRDHLPFNS